MQWFDGHLDLAYIADHGRDLTAENIAQAGGALQPASVSFPSLRAGGVRAAFATIFVRRRISAAQAAARGQSPVEGNFTFDTPKEAHAACEAQLTLYLDWAVRGFLTPLQIISEVNDLLELTKGSRIDRPLNTLLVAYALEGAAGIRTLADLDEFCSQGVRMVSLAWAEGSPYAGGDQSGGDVTPAGLQLIDRLDQLHCIHDVSHLSEASFRTLMDRAQGRIVASHSNCRALLPDAKHPERHLSDDQIRAIADRKGIIGVNLFARFLIPAAELATRRASIADVIRHIQHIEQIAGTRNCLALGSDMDSGFGRDLLPEDLDGPEHLHRLAEALADVGWSNHEIKKFTWSNWNQLLPPAP